MFKKAKLQHSNDYDRFTINEFNRNYKARRQLEESMKKYGFFDGFPLIVVENGGGKYRVICGNHRLTVARNLGLEFSYVILPLKDRAAIIDIIKSFELSTKGWSLKNWAEFWFNTGFTDYGVLLKFAKEYRLPLGAAASICMVSPNPNGASWVKDGKFAIVGNMSHAYAVARVVNVCRNGGVRFASAIGFVGAVSMTLRIPNFQCDTLLDKLKKYHGKMDKCVGWEQYLNELERVYNYRNGSKIALAFRAKEVRDGEIKLRRSEPHVKKFVASVINRQPNTVPRPSA